MSRETDSEFLEKRIEINRKNSSADFNAWLLGKLDIKAGEDVLDVGCGIGAQTIPFARLVGPKGSVSAIDIAEESIAKIKDWMPKGARIEAIVSDMSQLASVINNKFTRKQYDLAHSSYALYYAPNPTKVLDVMVGSLKPGGRCAIFVPNKPHGLVDLAARFTKIPKSVTDSLTFGFDVLEPYFKENTAAYDIWHFHNLITVKNAQTLIEFYRRTTYYDAAAEIKIRQFVNKKIGEDGSYVYEKNGYLIIGWREILP